MVTAEKKKSDGHGPNEVKRIQTVVAIEPTAEQSLTCSHLHR